MFQTYTVSSTGFVNYFPSAERSAEEVKNAIKKFGSDIVIINGSDNWNSPRIFRIEPMLTTFGIKILGEYHDGISGILCSGAVIKRADFEKFQRMFNRKKWSWYKLFPGHLYSESIKCYFPENEAWSIFFKLEIKENFELHKEEIHCPINNFKFQKKTFKWFK